MNDSDRPDPAAPRVPAHWRALGPVVQRAFRCRCDRPVFFGNTRCVACAAELGYELVVDLLHHVGTVLVGLVDAALQRHGLHGVDRGQADDILQVSLHRVDPVLGI